MELNISQELKPEGDGAVTYQSEEETVTNSREDKAKLAKKLWESDK